MDKKIIISTGSSRLSKNWKPVDTTWLELVKLLANVIRTNETVAEYKRMSKTEQGQVKDVGGFVGGYIEGGGRLVKGSVSKRYVITLDIDFANKSTMQEINDTLGEYEFVIYSTHSHTEKTPKLRLVVPMDRPVDCTEYEAVARRVASDIDINVFDPTTFEPERLMYWPSCPKDGVPVFIHNKGSYLSVDTYLAAYQNWHDVSLWPISDKASKLQTRELKKQGDPLEKPGAIGAFNRCYTIDDAISEFLSDVYVECDVPNRYTYKNGTSTAGLVVYEGGLFAYSHHGTDPTSGMLTNAYDLVRIHKFGHLDDDVEENVKINNLPSSKAMQEFAYKDVNVRSLLAKDQIAEFDDVVDESDYINQLEMNKFGKIKSTPKNILLILRNDPKLKGAFGLDEFAHRLTVLKDLPWRDKGSKSFWSDSDDASLRNYLSLVYGINGRGVIDDAVTEVMQDNRFNPVKDYLNNLKWDGGTRIDELFIEFLGAENNEYTKAVTRTWLVAAVNRVMHPGCKFDNAIVILGQQGMGKTLILEKLGKQWVNNSIQDIRSKDTMEQIQGSWIIELGEMAPTFKAEVEYTKSFISRQVDRFRAPYGRRTEEYPRQCVFAGTTNSALFLKDRTGNRRFWPIPCNKDNRVLKVWESFTKYEIDQIWAEAVALYKKGAPLALPENLEQMAIDIQNAHTEGSEKVGIIMEYLEMLLPPDWATRDLFERQDYIKHYDEEFAKANNYEIRDKVCAIEIWCEVFSGKPQTFTNALAREYNEILQNLKGWRIYKSESGNANPQRFGRLYGRQRAYVRE